MIFVTSLWALNMRVTLHTKEKKALFDYLEEYEQSTGEEIEFDIVAICCDFTEYADIEEIKANYNMIKNIDDLFQYTQVIEFDDGIIIQNF